MKPALAYREPILVTEVARDILFALAVIVAIYGTSRLVSLALGVFALAASAVLSCAARAMSLPVVLPSEPELDEADIPDGD